MLRGTGKSLFKRIGEGNHERAALGVMKTYFLMNDLTDEADAPFLEAGAEPAAALSAMDPEAVVAVLARRSDILTRQIGRLLVLQGFLVGQHHLEIVDPELRDKIATVFGSKPDRDADYIGNWLAVLKIGARAIINAASRASKAADFLLAFAAPAALGLGLQRPS